MGGCRSRRRPGPRAGRGGRAASGSGSSRCVITEDFAAGPRSARVAFADLKRGVPDWVSAGVRSVEADAVSRLLTGAEHGAVVGSHAAGPPEPLVGAGAAPAEAYATSAFHRVQGRVLFDLGGFIDDYAVDPVLRNDLGLLWLVTLDARGPLSLEAVPLTLDFCRTRLADGADAAWVEQRLTDACRAMGTEVVAEGRRLKMTFNATDRRTGRSGSWLTTFA